MYTYLQSYIPVASITIGIVSSDSFITFLIAESKPQAFVYPPVCALAGQSHWAVSRACVRPGSFLGRVVSSGGLLGGHLCYGPDVSVLQLCGQGWMEGIEPWLVDRGPRFRRQALHVLHKQRLKIVSRIFSHRGGPVDEVLGAKAARSPLQLE